MRIIGFQKAIEFSELERLLVALAPSVFVYFGKDEKKTVATELQSGSDASWEHTYRKYIFVNEDLTVEVLNETVLHDNSMTSELLYGIFFSVRSQKEMLSLSTRLNWPQTHKLFCRSDPQHPAFATHYLAQLQAATAAWQPSLT